MIYPVCTYIGLGVPESPSKPDDNAGSIEGHEFYVARDTDSVVLRAVAKQCAQLSFRLENGKSLRQLLVVRQKRRCGI